MALLKDQFSLTIQDGFSFYSVVNAAVLNYSETMPSAVVVVDTYSPEYEQTEQNIENEITIRERAQSLTDDLSISSGEGTNKITYTLSTYSIEFPYTLNGVVVPYYLTVSIFSSSPATTLALAPNTEQFDVYAANFLELYNRTSTNNTSTSQPSTNQISTNTASTNPKSILDSANEVAIRRIALSLTDNLVISSGEGTNRIIYTLSTYNVESFYDINRQRVKYYLQFTAFTTPVIEILLAPNTQQFNLYSANFLELYNRT